MEDKKVTFVDVIERLTDNIVIFIVIGVLSVCMFVFPDMREKIGVALIGALNLIIGKLFSNKKKSDTM